MQKSAGGSTGGWIGVDLDGCLAKYDGWKGPMHIGDPVPLMLQRVKDWLAAGQEVRIFTARVSHDGSENRKIEAAKAAYAIQLWCLEHLGQKLEITNEKDYATLEIWDDRAVQVEPNTGVILGRSTRGI